jgi:hypothetical protein
MLILIVSINLARRRFSRVLKDPTFQDLAEKQCRLLALKDKILIYGRWVNFSIKDYLNKAGKPDWIPHFTHVVSASFLFSAYFSQVYTAQVLYE